MSEEPQEDMTMQWVPPEDMDEECIALCVAMNKLPGISTIESCCGHGKYPYRDFSKRAIYPASHDSYIGRMSARPGGADGGSWFTRTVQCLLRDFCWKGQPASRPTGMPRISLNLSGRKPTLMRCKQRENLLCWTVPTKERGLSSLAGVESSETTV